MAMADVGDVVRLGTRLFGGKRNLRGDCMQHTQGLEESSNGSRKARCVYCDGDLDGN